MKKWEYRTQYISLQPSEEAQSMRHINKMGQDGWEMMHCSEVNYRLLKAVLKREISNE